MLSYRIARNQGVFASPGDTPAIDGKQHRRVIPAKNSASQKRPPCLLPGQVDGDRQCWSSAPMIANSAVHCRQRTCLARVLVVVLGLLLAGPSGLSVGATLAAGGSATPHAAMHSPTAAAPAYPAHGQSPPAGFDGGKAPDRAASPCAQGKHAAGHGGHGGCPCVHASCGGFVALLDNASPLGAIGALGFIDARRSGAPLPAHAYRPLRPPTQLNA